MIKLRVPAAGIACAAAFAILASAASAEVKVAHDSPPSLKLAGPYVWGHTFAEAIKAGGIAVKEYKRGALGGEAERLDQVSQGLLEVSMSAVQVVGKMDTLIYGAYLPYLYKDLQHFDRAVAQAKVIEKINAQITPKGVRLLAFTALGPEVGIFNTKHPVRSVADLKGLRMRALDKSQIALYKAWGATGTVVPWKEVPNALQTGVAHGYLNPVFVPALFGHTDFIKHFTDAKVSVAVRVAIASEQWYKGLKLEQRRTVDAAVARATKTNRDWTVSSKPAMTGMATGKGVTVIALSPEARAEFVKRSRTVYTQGVLKPDQLKVWTDAAKATE